MNVTYVSASDWLDLEKRYPDATRFLMEKNLRGELAHLERVSHSHRATGLPMHAMNVERLKELRAWETGYAMCGTMAIFEVDHICPDHRIYVNGECPACVLSEVMRAA